MTENTKLRAASYNVAVAGSILMYDRHRKLGGAKDVAVLEGGERVDAAGGGSWRSYQGGPGSGAGPGSQGDPWHGRTTDPWASALGRESRLGSRRKPLQNEKNDTNQNKNIAKLLKILKAAVFP